MKVSILTAVYNTASYLPQCIESVLAQTHRDWQLICIDDCSTDGSLDIINRYAATDSRITVVRNAENQGQAKARNAGLLHADGEIVTMLDSDDWIAPDALEKIVAAFEGNREIDCVLFDLQLYYSPDDVRPYHNAVSHTVTGYEAFRLSIAWQIHGVYAARRQVYAVRTAMTTPRVSIPSPAAKWHLAQLAITIDSMPRRARMFSACSGSICLWHSRICVENLRQTAG